MPTVWISRDAEQFLIDYLEPVLGVPVGSKSADSNEFLKVIRTGGFKPTPVSDKAQITFEAYALLDSRAWALAEQAREAVIGLAGTVTAGISVKEVTEAGGPAVTDDPVFEELTRYRFTLLIHLRAIPA